MNNEFDGIVEEGYLDSKFNGTSHGAGGGISNGFTGG